MKKLLVPFLAIIMLMSTLLFTGCSSGTEPGETFVNSQYVNLITVEKGDGYAILVDRNTKVMYLYLLETDNGWAREGITVIYKREGKPKIYSEVLN